MHENDKMEEHGREEMAEETKASGNVRRNQIFLQILLFVIRTKQLSTIYLENYAWIDENFLKK